MDAVGRDHDVSRDAHAVGESEDGLLVILLEADASVAGLDDVGGQPVDEHCEQVGAVHAVELDLARELRRPHRRGDRSRPGGETAGRPIGRPSGPARRRGRAAAASRTPFGWIATPAPTSVRAGACS